MILEEEGAKDKMGEEGAEDEMVPNHPTCIHHTLGHASNPHKKVRINIYGSAPHLNAVNWEGTFYK